MVANATNKQAGFMNNCSNSIGKLINIISRNIKQIIDHEMSNEGIGHGQYHLIHIVSNNEGISQKDLVDLMNIDKANVARGIKKLEEKMFVKRIQNTDDNRIYNIYLTEKGMSLIPELKKARCRITEICTENLSDTETGELFRLLEKVKTSVVERTAETKGK
jgi:DNA-binding MarR family transcriptional regulator